MNQAGAAAGAGAQQGRRRGVQYPHTTHEPVSSRYRSASRRSTRRSPSGRTPRRAPRARPPVKSASIITSGMFVERIQMRNSPRYATADAKPMRKSVGTAPGDALRSSRLFSSARSSRAFFAVRANRSAITSSSGASSMRRSSISGDASARDATPSHGARFDLQHRAVAVARHDARPLPLKLRGPREGRASRSGG